MMFQRDAYFVVQRNYEMTITRRTFLKTTLNAALAAAIPVFSSRHAFARSERAVREFRFTARPQQVSLGKGPDFYAWTYNGQVPGPEIRVKEGEIIRVILENRLPEGTSIHWHGLPVPNAMDGVPGVTQEPVKPRETFIYEFEARPAGTFIYHSHSGYQLDQGLYGPLIIDPISESRGYDREYALMLEDWVMKDGGGVAATRRRPPMGMMGGMMEARGGMGMMGGLMGRRGMGMMGRGSRSAPGENEPLLEPLYDAYAVNGRVYPEVPPLMVTKGDRVKLRLMNPSSATIYHLRLAGHPLTITNADGNPVKPLVTDVLRIGMGERYDVEFAADNPGNWLLAAQELGFGESMLQVPVHYRGVSPQRPVEPDFRRGLRMASYRELEALIPSDEPAPRSADRFYTQTLSGGMHSPFWTINGRVYPDLELMVVQKGELVRIGYTNHSMMPHPMHLHGHFFRVINPRVPPYRWILKDTIVVDPMQRVEIEFVANNPGRWFHHCHNLYHMEAGMANLVVYRS